MLTREGSVAGRRTIEQNRVSLCSMYDEVSLGAKHLFRNINKHEFINVVSCLGALLDVCNKSVML